MNLIFFLLYFNRFRKWKLELSTYLTTIIVFFYIEANYFKHIYKFIKKNELNNKKYPSRCSKEDCGVGVGVSKFPDVKF